jgi:hypothetical protein
MDIGQGGRAVIVDLHAQMRGGRAIGGWRLHIGIHHEVVGGDHFHPQRAILGLGMKD